MNSIQRKFATFYDRPEWKELRYRILAEQGKRCRLCGVTAVPGVVIQVDHILPISIYPELALSASNLQVLCRECNIGKSNRFFDDFRPTALVVERVKRIANDPREIRARKISRIRSRLMAQLAAVKTQESEKKWMSRLNRFERIARRSLARGAG